MNTSRHESSACSVNDVIDNAGSGSTAFKKRSARRKRSISSLRDRWDNSGTIHTMWMALPEAIRRRWKPASPGVPLNEYDLFFGANVFRMTRGQPFIITRSSGFFGADNYIISSTRRGEISIFFTPECRDVNITVILQKCTGTDRFDPPEVRKDIFRRKIPVRIKGLSPGSDYYLYCITTDGPLDTACGISGSIGCRITVI